MGQPQEADRRRKVRWPFRKTPYEFERKGLFALTREEYGEKYGEHFLELYKFYADTACQVSGQRVSANTFFLTLNSTIVAVWGLGASFVQPKLFLILVPGAGLLVSLTWSLLIASYRSLNKAKYDLIWEMEEHLPVRLYHHEWDLLDHGKTKMHRPQSSLESLVPVIFALLYILLFVYACRVPTVPPKP